MPIPAGTMNRRLVLERTRVNKATDGQPRQEFDPLATVWARKETLAGSERFARQQVVAEATTKWTIRWRVDVDPLHAVYDVAERRRYDVLEVLEVGNREGLAIMARTRAEK